MSRITTQTTRTTQHSQAREVLTVIAGENGAVYATILMTVLLLVFAEVLPKTLAINYPDAMSLRVVRFITPFVSIFGPLLAAVEWIVRSVLRLVGVELGHGRTMLSPYEELKGAVDILHEEGNVERSARDMFGGLLDLQVLHVADVMIHRTKMRTIDADLPPVQIVREVLSSPFTRMPLWRERPDNFVGVLHSKDLLRALDAAGGDASKINIDEVMFAPWFVPEATTLEDQLEAFLKRKTHFALVVDEYGEVMGLVTLEDILEEIVGDIRDEHDLAVQGVRPQPDGSVLVDGSVPVRDLNRVMRHFPALHQQDVSPSGFQWLRHDDCAQSVLAFERRELGLAALLFPAVLLGNTLGNKAFGKVSDTAWRLFVGFVLGAAALAALWRLLHA